MKPTTKHMWIGAVAGAIGVLVVLVVGGLAYMYSGAYDIAATDPHEPVLAWALETTMEQSVEEHADAAPEPIEVDSALLVHGFEHFDAMCVVCHGAPGVERGEYGKGLTPEPPELSEVVDQWSTRELFWIVKHGIKMSGMPAFGPTHTDEEIWAIVAAVRRLDTLTPEEYQAMVALASGGHAHNGGGDGHESRAGGPTHDEARDTTAGHIHAPGTPPHEH